MFLAFFLSLWTSALQLTDTSPCLSELRLSNEDTNSIHYIGWLGRLNKIMDIKHSTNGSLKHIC